MQSIASDFCTAADCIQLIQEPTHNSGNRLDLVFTDAPATSFYFFSYLTYGHNILWKLDILSKGPIGFFHMNVVYIT